MLLLLPLPSSNDLHGPAVTATMIIAYALPLLAMLTVTTLISFGSNVFTMPQPGTSN